MSEAEPVRDSNYAGSDLYWEQRFYQVKPGKHPKEAKEEENKENYHTNKCTDDEAELLN